MRSPHHPRPATPDIRLWRGWTFSYLMPPGPDRIAFLIPQHQSVRAFHNFPCEDEVGSAIFHLRSSKGKLVALSEAHTHVVHKRFWAEVQVNDILAILHHQVGHILLIPFRR